MKFRTEIEIQPSALRLDPERPFVALGSCFSERIRQRMEACGWEAVNPLGTLYNPLSIAKALELALLPEEQAAAKLETSIFQDENGVHHSWLLDSGFSAPTHERCLAKCREAMARLREALSRAQAMSISFGTAWLWELAVEPGGTGCEPGANVRKTGTTGGEARTAVGNCHKQPSSLFRRRRMGLEETVALWTDLAGLLRSQWPALELLFTVSPVRYRIDGLAGNSRSKALLLLAVEQLCDNLPDCHYFPAFEILNDDLRDYRFYAPDMLHPTEQASDYVWERFQQTYLDAPARQRLETQRRQRLRTLHRPILAD